MSTDEPKIVKGKDLREDLACGCWRAIVARKVLAYDESGKPKLDAAGKPTYEEHEEIEESYCQQHTERIIERQAAVQKALDEGRPSEEAMALMVGASPFALPAHGESE